MGTTLDAFREKISELRSEAGRVRGGYNDIRAAISASPDYTAQGRQAQLADYRDDANSRLRDLARAEDALTASTREKLRVAIFPTVGSTPDAIIAHRDAQDRADQITSQDEAKRIMHRALEDQDAPLARAILRRAVGEGALGGFGEVAQMYRQSNPADAARLDDMLEFDRVTSDLNFRFTQGITYGEVQK